MPQSPDELDPVSAAVSRRGGAAAVVYGVIGVLTVVVVHATLTRGGAPAAEGAVGRATAVATPQVDSPVDPRAGALATEAAVASPPPELPVVSASPRRAVRVGVEEGPRAPNPLLQRSRPVPAETVSAAVEQLATDRSDLLSLPTDATSDRGPSPLGPYLAHGRLYGAPGGSRVVYLIDASGSQVDTLPFVQQAVQRAVRSLRPEQTYAVMFFNSRGITEAQPTGMKSATAQAVAETDRFVDPQAGRVVAGGRPDGRAAIRRALAYRPDTVVLLSDGLTGRRDPLGDRADLLALIDTANLSGARFHTIQVRQADPLATPRRRGTLELIASRTGGAYRFVSDAELPIR